MLSKLCHNNVIKFRQITQPRFATWKKLGIWLVVELFINKILKPTAFIMKIVRDLWILWDDMELRFYGNYVSDL